MTSSSHQFHMFSRGCNIITCVLQKMHGTSNLMQLNLILKNHSIFYHDYNISVELSPLTTINTYMFDITILHYSDHWYWYKYKTVASRKKNPLLAMVCKANVETKHVHITCCIDMFPWLHYCYKETYVINYCM